MLCYLADNMGPTEIQTYADNRDYESYNRLRGFISDPKGPFTPSPSQPRTPQPNAMLPPIEPTYTLPNGHPRPPQPYPVAMPPRAYTAGFVPLSFLFWSQTTKWSIALQPRFKDSPFYTVLEPLTSVVECKGMPPGILIMY